MPSGFDMLQGSGDKRWAANINKQKVSKNQNDDKNKIKENRENAYDPGRKSHESYDRFVNIQEHYYEQYQKQNQGRPSRQELAANLTERLNRDPLQVVMQNMRERQLKRTADEM